MATPETQPKRTFLPDQRTVWRWHFYAGLFCIPFVMWLSVTGGIYLFKPQVEAWLDRPYDGLLPPSAQVLRPELQVKAALATLPSSNLHFYEPPRHPGSAAQIIIGKGEDEFRVYVHPSSGAVLKVVNEDERFMKLIFRLHGELLAGDRGSLLVELAASWTVVMILTGLILWWPKKTERLAGILYPRLSLSGRFFWRDLHSVTGMWVSFFALFLLFTGLPWAKSWGGYFKRVRGAVSAVAINQDWTTGRSSELAQREARNADSGASAPVPGEGHDHAASSAPAPPRFGKKARARGGVPAPDAYAPLDTILPVVGPLKLAYPVQIVPPRKKGEPWLAQSDSQNRTLRDVYSIDGASGKILRHQTFGEKPFVDRLVSLGISAHEGHLFGILNQLLGVFTAASLFLLAVSSVILWWRRRPAGMLGAPVPLRNSFVSRSFLAIIAVLSIYLPLLGATIILVALTERLVLRRLPPVAAWLGLQASLASR